MAHSHHHGTANHSRAFAVGIALNMGFVLIEAGFGFATGSMALLADAGHNLSDVIGLLLAWGADFVSKFRPTPRRTYGWRSATIMAALVNGFILLTAVGGIIWESIRRFLHPAPVAAGTVIIVAALGLCINTITALFFFADRKRDLNIRGAFLHMAADAGVSAGVVMAGFGIMATGRLWIDPVISLVIAGIILFSTWGLLKEAMNLALQAVPAGINPVAVSDYLSGLPGVCAVHDLHIWAMSTTETALTAHLIKPATDNDDDVIAEAQKTLHHRFGINHVTIQLERSDNFLKCGNGCAILLARTKQTED